MKMFDKKLEATRRDFLSSAQAQLTKLKNVRAELDEDIRDLERLIRNRDPKAKQEKPYLEMKAAEAAHAHLMRYGPMERERLKKELVEGGACSNRKHPHRSIGQGIGAALKPPRKHGHAPPKPSLFLLSDGRIALEEEEG